MFLKRPKKIVISVRKSENKG